MGWACSFDRWQYYGRSVDVYLAAIRNPRVVGGPSSIEDALAGGELFIFENGMAGAYKYTGTVKGPTWRLISFPPAPLSGSIPFVTPADPYFTGNWVFATAFLYGDGSGWVRPDLPVENSNRTILAP
jgi:hypothetical protein